MARQVPIPPAARALSTLARIDYEDGFLADTGSGRARTAEEWARAMLEDAPLIVRAKLRWAWFALGLKLSGARSEHFVLGWAVRRRTPDFVLLGAGSRLGMPAELLFRRERDSLLIATFVQHDNPLARAIWAPVAPTHRRVVPVLLERGVRSGAGRPREADRPARAR
jgi:hypothetical protein